MWRQQQQEVCSHLQTSLCRQSPPGRGISWSRCSPGACRSPPATSTPHGTPRGRTFCAGSGDKTDSHSHLSYCHLKMFRTKCFVEFISSTSGWDGLRGILKLSKFLYTYMEKILLYIEFRYWEFYIYNASYSSASQQWQFCAMWNQYQ